MSVIIKPKDRMPYSSYVAFTVQIYITVDHEYCKLIQDHRYREVSKTFYSTFEQALYSQVEIKI